MARTTPCPLGTIHHRPDTRLLPPPRQRCLRGHAVPRYGNGDCVACAKLRAYDWLAANATRPTPRGLHRFTSYARASAKHAEIGGWLLDLGDGSYGVTDQLAVVRRHRSLAWVRRCDRLGEWDETALEDR